MINVPALERFEERFRDPVWIDIGLQIFHSSGIRADLLTRSEQGESLVLIADDQYILKVYKPTKDGFRREVQALERLSGKRPIPVPEIIAAGEFEGYKYSITSRIPGRLVTRAEWLTLDSAVQIDVVDQLATTLKAIHALPSDDVEFDWPTFVARNAANALDRQRSEGGNPEWLESLPKFIEENLGLVQTAPPYAFLHGDVHFGNLRFAEQSGRLRISGLFDFADSLKGSHEYEFIAVGVLMLQGQCELQREFFGRYGYEGSSLNEEMRRRMMMLTILYEWSSLRRYAERLRPEALGYTLDELERAIWAFA